MGTVARHLGLGGFVEGRAGEEGFGLGYPIGQQGEGWTKQLAEIRLPSPIGVDGVGGRPTPTFGSPQRLQLVAQHRGPLAVEHLAVQPIELVPIESGPGLIHPLEAKDGRGLLEGEALVHSLRRRPTQQGHVVGQGLGGIAHGLEVADGGHPIALGKLFALLVEDEGGVGEHGHLGAQGRVEQQLLGRIGDVVFAADHMGDGHGGVINDHHEVVERITDLIGGGPPGDHHVAAQIGASPTHGATHQVGPGDRGAIVDAEAHRGLPALGDKGGLLPRGEVAVAVVVARGLFSGCLELPHGGELGLRGIAAVGMA